eukprot:768526-Hanusia_phi.AAC.4
MAQAWAWQRGWERKKKGMRPEECAGCRATVTEIAKKSGPAKKRFESRVIPKWNGYSVADLQAGDGGHGRSLQDGELSVFLGDHEDTVEQSILGQGSDAFVGSRQRYDIEIFTGIKKFHDDRHRKVCEGVDIAKQERPTVIALI